MMFRILVVAVFLALAWLLVRRPAMDDSAANGKARSAKRTQTAGHADRTLSGPRRAEPENIRDHRGRGWDKIDEASDGSFPASDPPGYR